ncbi:MAG: hypothetical protein ACRCXT_14910 [Paraclostridium sp.]
MDNKNLITLIKEFKFRLDYVDNEEKILCYDKRIDQFFTMKKEFYEILCLLKAPIVIEEIYNCNKVSKSNIELLLKGLNYRSLLRRV